MHIGIDFDGTIIKYAVCAASDGGDGRIIITAETLESAKHELKLVVNRAKKRKHPTETKFWIMKQTFKYERVFEHHIEE